ncbi:gluconeogenesis transcription factor RDS2 [Aspergillus undulatus]|uniref:gluconeogenesis transcription factor RDS2 n=1 Tax=Aspergillus undulatus TaxID=1810928 RepID=UPI003CCD9A37
MTCDSERPCTRCIKRNIGHLCHDEPREPSKRSRSEHEQSAADEEGSSNNEYPNVHAMPRKVDIPDAAGQQILADGTLGLASSSMNAVQPGPMPSSTGQNMGVTSQQQLLGYNDWVGGQSQFQDMHTFHPSYMFNAPEVTNEYNLLGDFLSNSLLDDGGMFQNDDMQRMYSDPTLINSMAVLGGPNQTLLQQSQSLQPPQSQQNEATSGPSATVGNDKARETYYMTAADPSGSDPPEERMNKLLKAKYDAGLLRPFNYVKGYARLNQYMEKHLQPGSRQKILRQLDKFRPKFRERMQSLTDIELILVEMWFERSLMEYDRVFASMAIPACCWRRTGEIFRGNKEMAELIGVPIEALRDGKLAIHEIIVEDQLVSYWEKFGAIAFDNTQKAMLTSCTLKNPNAATPSDGIPCCFSFTIRRDNHNIPSLIVGNFLPSQRKSK